MPERIQLSRRKGWRKPAGAVVVARPGRWGNPHRVGAPHPDHGRPIDRGEAVELFRRDLLSPKWWLVRANARRELAARTLACWCAIGSPCHADVLIEVANSPEAEAANP